MGRYNAAVHWAKLEVPPGHEQGGQAGKDLVKLRARLAARYPVAQVRRRQAHLFMLSCRQNLAFVSHMPVVRLTNL